MEILGDDEAGLPPPPVRRPVFAEELALDGPDPARRNGSAPHPADGHPDDPDDPDDADDPDAGPEGAHGRGRLLLDTLLGPEALGISGLLVATTGGLTSGLSPVVLMFRPDGFAGLPGATSFASYYAPLLFGLSALSLALGVAAVLRVRPSSAGWVRGVAGATVIVSVLMLGATGWAVWNAAPPAASAAF